MGQAGAAADEADDDADEDADDAADEDEDEDDAAVAVFADAAAEEDADEDAEVAPDEAAALVLTAGGDEDDGAELVQPATPIPATATTAIDPMAASRPATLVEPNIPRPLSAAQAPQLSVAHNRTVYTPSKDVARLAAVGLPLVVITPSALGG